MRRAGRIDGNHTEIVKALRAIGCSVQALASMGGGVPDLLCGFHGRNVLLEVKDGSKPPSARVLTTEEGKWHAAWGGQVEIVCTAEEAQRAVIRGAGL